MFFFLILKFRSMFVIKPTKELIWSVNDFNLGKKWAKSQPHSNPIMKNKTLWDEVYSYPYESVEVIHNLNKKLGFK